MPPFKTYGGGQFAAGEFDDVAFVQAVLFLGNSRAVVIAVGCVHAVALAPEQGAIEKPGPGIAPKWLADESGRGQNDQ